MSPEDRKLMEEARDALSTGLLFSGSWYEELYAKLTERLAQPELEKGSWQHAVDDALVNFGKTAAEFASHSAAVEFAAAGNLFHTKEDAEAAALARREAK